MDRVPELTSDGGDAREPLDPEVIVESLEAVAEGEFATKEEVWDAFQS